MLNDRSAGQRDRVQNRNARRHLLNEFRRDCPIDLDLVFLFMPARRAEQAIDDFAVAREQKQSFRILVQPPDGEDANRVIQVIHHVHRFPRVGGTDDAARLI